MKKFLAVISLMAVCTCSGSNQYGKCVGIMEKENPKLEYNINIWNTFWSAIGFEWILPPVLWVTSYAKCPIGPAEK